MVQKRVVAHVCASARSETKFEGQQVFARLHNRQIRLGWRYAHALVSECNHKRMVANPTALAVAKRVTVLMPGTVAVAVIVKEEKEESVSGRVCDDRQTQCPRRQQRRFPYSWMAGAYKVQ
jgi:hypothetical protein